MSAPKTPPAPETPGRSARPRGRGASGPFARIRMYNVGFGDAFLLFLPTPAGEKKVLIDCGSIALSPEGITLSRVVEAIVDASTDDRDGVVRPRIDVVIATHRHRDHVSGFDRPIWGEVEVKEVWMPWTEHPTAGDARLVREAQVALAARLHGRLASLSDKEYADVSAGMPLREIARNALANEAAMHTLHHGFLPPAPRRRFLPDTPTDRTLVTEALPGILVHILGPSRDPGVIRDLNPPVGESYLRMASADSGGAGAPDPFERRWFYPPTRFRRRYKHLSYPEDVRKQVRFLDGELTPAAALALDKAINGTSLMLMFQIGQTHLLFPGDAQWGTWQVVMDDPEWRALLGKTKFYKVGHHGSHNATPRQFVEKILSDSFWGGMVSVCETERWEEIPKKELLRSLGTPPRKIVRSDALGDLDPAEFTVEDDRMYVEARVDLSAESERPDGAASL
jgi:hypothetical protein